MSKKSNTVLFMLGATVFNIVVTVACFVLLLVLYGRLLAPLLPATVAAWGLPVIFVGSIVLAFFVYKFAIQFMMKRIDADAVFDPLFRPRRSAKRRD
jgi:hypothetical protein